MTEEQVQIPEATTEEEKVEPSEDVVGKKSEETTDLIEKAKMTAERLEAANVQALKIVERHEQLMAKALLGGKTIAGQKQKTQSEIEQEEADQLVKDFFK